MKNCVYVTFNVFQCSVTCGSGTETRAVVCTLQDRQSADEIHCDMDVKPESERKCLLEDCKPEDFDIGVIITNTVVGISHWRTGPWSAVSINFSSALILNSKFTQ